MDKASKILIACLSALILVLVAKVNYVSYKAGKTVVAYYIPKGYAGWVTIRYNIKGAPPIPFTRAGVGGMYKIMVPKSGIVETSSPLYEEWHRTKYYRYDEKGAESFHAGYFGGLSSGKHIDRTWMSSGVYNSSFLHFYIFNKPVPLSQQPPEPAGKHIIK